MDRCGGPGFGGCRDPFQQVGCRLRGLVVVLVDVVHAVTENSVATFVTPVGEPVHTSEGDTKADQRYRLSESDSFQRRRRRPLGGGVLVGFRSMRGASSTAFEAVGGRPVPETLLVAAARLPEVPALGERDGGCTIQVDRASRRRSEAVTGRRRHANTRWVARSFPLREGPAIAAKGISVRRRAPLRDSRLREVR